MLLFPLCFWNTFFKLSKSNSSKRGRNGPGCFSFNWRGLSHTGTSRRGYITRCPGCFREVRPRRRQRCAASPSVVLASWPCFRTALPVVNSLFGKTVAHSNSVITVHDGNEKKKKKIYKISVPGLCGLLSVSTPSPEKNQWKQQSKIQRSKTQLPNVCRKGWLTYSVVVANRPSGGSGGDRILT